MLELSENRKHFKVKLTSLFNAQYNIKIKNPCSELRMTNIYWNTIAASLINMYPNTQVLPMIGVSNRVPLKDAL